MSGHHRIITFKQPIINHNSLWIFYVAQEKTLVYIINRKYNTWVLENASFAARVEHLI